MKKVYRIAFFVLATSNSVSAQNGVTIYPPPPGYTFLQNRIRNDLKTDNNNNVWVAFQRIGLGKFDGTNWTIYNPSNSSFPDTTVYEIAFDAAQNLWAGTNKGLVMFDGTNFTLFNSSNSSLPYDTIRALAINGNDKWLGTYIGAVKFDGTNSVTYNTSNSGIIYDTTNAFAFGMNGEIYIGTKIGFSKFYNSTWTNYNSATDPNFVNNRITNLYVDSGNELWLGAIGVSSKVIYKLENGIIKEFYQDLYMGTIQPFITPYGFFEYNGNRMLFYSNGTFIEEDPEEYIFYYLNAVLPGGIMGYELAKSNNGLIWVLPKVGAGGDTTKMIFSFDFSQYTNFHSWGVTNSNFKYLDINNVKAAMLNRGDMHWNLVNGSYEVPKDSGKHSVFASALWIGGLDSAGNLHMAAMTYRQTGVDFWPGPIDTVSGVADSVSVVPYDRIWKINRFKIEEFKYNYQLGNVQNGTYYVSKDIREWPAHGTGNISRNLAPFVDYNTDGIYNYMDGDYPLIKGDQMLYWIFNDNLSVHDETGGLPLGFEIHASAYSYTCPNIADSNSVLNTTTLYNYRIINRSNNNYDSLFIGLWCDGDLGEYSDDYVGCDTVLNAGFFYNGDNDDQGIAGYGLNPPMQNVQILKGPEPVLNDGLDNDHDGTIDEAGELCMMDCFHFYDGGFSICGNPQDSLQFYYYMTSRWLDGSHIMYGDNCGGNTFPTNFMYSGIPYDTAGWTEFTTGTSPGDRRFVESSGPFSIAPGAETIIDFAYVFTWDSTAPNGLTTSIARNISDLQRIKYWFDTDSFPSCLLLNVGVEESVENNMQLAVFPNPVSTELIVNCYSLTGKEIQKMEIKIFDIIGTEVLQSSIFNFQSSIKLNVKNLSSGLYILQLKAGENIYRKKFVKG